MERSDSLALAVIILVFILMAWASWLRWCNPVIDGGREMNQPLRLLQGDRLYLDVYNLYGPFSPYFNALLYKIFGAHLRTLYSVGLVSSLIVVWMIYWIGRQVMPPPGAALATLIVIVLCIFKQAGNYIFPYTYAALYGTVFDMATVVFLIRYMRNRKWPPMVVAGGWAGMAMICKSEFGLAAMGTGLLAIGICHWRDLQALLRKTLCFTLPALSIVVLAYGLVLDRVPWQVLANDSYMFLTNVPPGLVYFNKARMGIDEPYKALMEMMYAAAWIVTAGMLIAIAGLGWHKSKMQERQRSLVEKCLSKSCRILIASSTVLACVMWVAKVRVDRGPYRAAPLILLLFLMYLLWRHRKSTNDVHRSNHMLLVVLTVHSLLVLFRVILRIPSGGAYGAYLLPTPIIVLTYLATVVFPKHYFPLPEVRKTAQRLTLGMFVLGAVLTVTVVVYRYQHEPYYTVSTPRGTMSLRQNIGPAFEEAIRFIEKNTSPEDPIFTAPEGTSLNFLCNRRNPERYEILTPGFLTAEKELQAVRRLQDAHVRFIFILNRPTTEFGPEAFGRDYNKILMSWIERNYHVREVFGQNKSKSAMIGDEKFFIKAYERNNETEYCGLFPDKEVTHSQIIDSGRKEGLDSIAWCTNHRFPHSVK